MEKEGMMSIIVPNNSLSVPWK